LADVDAAVKLTRVPDLGTTADICAALARVQDPGELPALLERAAAVLEATGLVVWMPESPSGVLRPVLAHGYQPQALAKMGTIAPSADNATALAYRTRSVQVVPAEPLSGGAIVAPLVTSDGCSGAMAVELRHGVDPADHLRAVAMIFAAQLATLITPAQAAAPPAPPVPPVATWPKAKDQT